MIAAGHDRTCCFTREIDARSKARPIGLTSRLAFRPQSGRALGGLCAGTLPVLLEVGKRCFTCRQRAPSRVKTKSNLIGTIYIDRFDYSAASAVR